jgi:hypothetical protein
LAERIESTWYRVGRSDHSQFLSERVVRDVAHDSNKSHDEMLRPKRWRHCNLGKWYREKKSEMSTLSDLLVFRNMNDSALLDQISSPSGVTEEMTESRSAALWLSR